MAPTLGPVTAAKAGTAAITNRVRVAPALSQDDSSYSRYSSYSKHRKGAWTLDPDGSRYSRYSSYSKQGNGSSNLGQVTAAPAGTAAIASRVRVAPAVCQDDSSYSRYSSYSKHGKGSLDSGHR